MKERQSGFLKESYLFIHWYTTKSIRKKRILLQVCSDPKWLQFIATAKTQIYNYCWLLVKLFMLCKTMLYCEIQRASWQKSYLCHRQHYCVQIGTIGDQKMHCFTPWLATLSKRPPFLESFTALYVFIKVKLATKIKFQLQIIKHAKIINEITETQHCRNLNKR